MLETSSSSSSSSRILNWKMMSSFCTTKTLCATTTPVVTIFVQSRRIVAGQRRGRRQNHHRRRPGCGRRRKGTTTTTTTTTCMSAPNVMMADGKDRASVAAIAEEVATAYGVVEANGRGAVYLGSSRIGRGEKQYEASKELAREVGTLLGCTTWSGIGPGLMDAVTMGGLTANGRASGKCGIDDDDDEEKEFVRIDRFGFSLCVRVILFLLRKRRVSVAFLRSFAGGRNVR